MTHFEAMSSIMAPEPRIALRNALASWFQLIPDDFAAEDYAALVVFWNAQAALDSVHGTDWTLKSSHPDLFILPDNEHSRKFLLLRILHVTKEPQTGYDAYARREEFQNLLDILISTELMTGQGRINQALANHATRSECHIL
jgi:hypothetical protein